MEKIFITGGLGNIGIDLAKKLSELGHQIIIFDNREDRTHIHNDDPNIQIILGDVLNLDHIKRSILGVTGIIHLAALSRVIWGYENPHKCVEVNVMGVINVLEAARTSVRKPWVIFGSSREVYGEPDSFPVNENAPKKIANVYGVTKLMGENLLEKYCENYGLSGITLRFSNVYGSIYDQLDRVTPKFIIRASKGLPIYLQGGDQIFDFTHIEDTVNGILKSIKLLSNKSLNEEINYYDDFHILTGQKTSLKDLVRIIQNNFVNPISTKISPPRSYDVETFYGDISKTKHLLKFQANIDIETGIKLYLTELSPYLGQANKLKK